MKELIKKYFELKEEMANIEKRLSESVVLEHEKTLNHRFKIVSDVEVEFFDVRTGAKHAVTPPAVGMHIDSGSWRVLE